MRYFKSNKYPIEFVLSENIEKHFASHNHVGHYVISLIVSGTVEVQKGDKKTEYRENDIFIMPPYTTHAIAQKKDSSLLSLCIGTSFIEKYPLPLAEEIMKNNMKKLSETDKSNTVGTINTADTITTVGTITTVQKVKLLRALSMVYDSYEKDKVNFQPDIATLTDKIVTQSEGKLDLEDLAQAVFMSKYYLIRKFKNIVGMTPHQFQIQNRVRQAQRLLDEGSTIIEAATQMGFYDQSHFNKCFLKIVGISPAEYIGSRIDF